MQNLCLLEAVDDGGTKEGLPLHGNAIKEWPGQISIEVDLTSRIGLVHSIPGRPHSGLQTKSISKGVKGLQSSSSIQAANSCTGS